MSEVIRSNQMPVQVAWPGVQFPSVRGDTFGIGNDDVDNATAQEALDPGPTQD